MYNVSRIFFNKRLYFSCYVAGYFLDSPHMLHCVYHASMMDNLGCFHLLATVNKAAMVMGVQYQF